jgi:predicted RNA binding protein YcfA (HicA-like mRNA interferase family)
LPRLPRITGADAIRALRRVGWVEVRRRGSHILLRHPDRPERVTVPVHAGAVLKPKTRSSILDQAGITVEEFRGLL